MPRKKSPPTKLSFSEREDRMRIDPLEWAPPKTLEDARKEKNEMIQELFSDPTAYAAKLKKGPQITYGYGPTTSSPEYPKTKSGKKPTSYKMSKKPKIPSLDKRKRKIQRSKPECPAGCVPERMCTTMAAGPSMTEGRKTESSILEDLVRRAEAADKLQKYDPVTGDYFDVDPMNPASALFPEQEDEGDDSDELFFTDAPKKTKAPSRAASPPPSRPASPRPARKSGGLPSKFQQFLAARRNADAGGDGTFEWQGKKYVKGQWANGTPVWKKAENIPVVRATVGLPTMDLPIVTPTPLPTLTPIPKGTRIPKNIPRVKAIIPKLQPIG